MDEILQEHGGYIVIGLLAIGLAFAIGYATGNQGESVRTVIVQQNAANSSVGQVTVSQTAVPQTVRSEPLDKIALLLPAVNQNNEGLVATLEIERRNGTGRAFVNFDENKPIIANETQNSIKNALHVVRSFDQETSRRFSQSDVSFVFRSTAQEVAGESAGAAMTIGAIAILNGRAINPQVAITGKINPDGSIGKVGQILAKARALKRMGITTFLVPTGDAIQENTFANQSENCTEEVISGGAYRSCTTQSSLQTTTVNVSSEVGINVIEVGSIVSAYPIMVQAG